MGRGLAKHTITLRTACYEFLIEHYPCTVRAVCYWLFVQGITPDMSDATVKKISRLLTQARKDGFISWEWIVDETRELSIANQWDDPSAFTESVKRSYRRDLWSQQPQRVEIWSEKGTMNGTLGPVLDEYGVGFRVFRGFTSTSSMNTIVKATAHDPLPLRVFYVGDFDPSGMCMSERDIPKRLREYGARVEFSRLALTADDLASPELADLSFPAKKSDSRYAWFVKKYGQRSWELDAMSPVVVRDRVEAAIVSMITDVDAWQRYRATEQAELASLNDVLGNWAAMTTA